MTCSHCSHTVVFDPKKDNISDGTFKKLITTLRGSVEVYFTKNQLYTHYLSSNPPSCTGRFLLLALLFFSVFFLFDIGYVRHNWFGESPPVELILVGLFALAMTGLFNLSKPKNITRDSFEILIQRWLKHYPIPNILLEPSLEEGTSLPFTENDLYDYGVESIVIVDEDIYVDLFVYNNYLSDWKAVIISQSGYPNYLIEKVQAIINQNPTVTIKYLHNSTTTMPAMQSRVRQFLQLPQLVEEIDVGLQSGDSNLLSIFKQRVYEKQGVKLDFMSPQQLALNTGAAVIGGILISEAMRASSSSNAGGDFG